MIRVHTGRGWRLNPQLLAELRAGGNRGDRQPPIMDVFGIEVDGVDVFAGLSEDRVVELSADLAAAVSRLSSGYRRAQVSCSGGAVELLLERRGALVALSLVRLQRPSAVLVSDLELELSGFGQAVLRSGKTLLEELRHIHPRLANASPAQRLAHALALGKVHPEPDDGGASDENVSRPQLRAAARGEARLQERVLVSQGRHRTVGAGRESTPPTAAFRLELQEVAAGLQSFGGGRADLRSLLVQGRLTLHIGAELGSWSSAAPPFLLLRDAVKAGLEMLRAIEQGDVEHELMLDAGVGLSFRLAAPGGEATGEAAGPATAAFFRDTNRGRQPGTQGFQPCDPEALLTSIFEAAIGFADLANRENARQSQNPPLAALLADAREGLVRCQELSTPSRSAAPLGAPPRSVLPDTPLGPGRLKLLGYQQQWQRSVGSGVRRIQLTRGSVLVEGERSLVALDKDTGEVQWTARGEGGLLALPKRSGDNILAISREVRLVDRGGLIGWRAAMRETVRDLLVCSEGAREVVAAAGDSEVRCLSSQTGDGLWRFAPAGAQRLSLFATRGRLLIATGDGRLYCVSPAAGTLWWRATGRPLSLSGAGGVAPYQPWPVVQRWLLAQRGSEVLGISLLDGSIRRIGQPELPRLAGAVALGTTWVLAGQSANGGGSIGGLRRTPSRKHRGRLALGGGPAVGPRSAPFVGGSRRPAGSQRSLAEPCRARRSRSLEPPAFERGPRWAPAGEAPRGGVRSGRCGGFCLRRSQRSGVGPGRGGAAAGGSGGRRETQSFAAGEEGPLRALRVLRFLSVV